MLLLYFIFRKNTSESLSGAFGGPSQMISVTYNSMIMKLVFPTMIIENENKVLEMKFSKMKRYLVAFFSNKIFKSKQQKNFVGSRNLNY